MECVGKQIGVEEMPREVLHMFREKRRVPEGRIDKRFEEQVRKQA